MMNSRSLAPTPDVEALASMLCAQAHGSCPDEAAVQVLTGTAVWLHRTDFIRRYVAIEDRPAFVPTPMARVEWRAVAADLDAGDGLPCSRSEASILRIAASLAGVTTGIDLGSALCGLDSTRLTVVLAACAHAAGRGSIEVRFR